MNTRRSVSHKPPQDTQNRINFCRFLLAGFMLVTLLLANLPVPAGAENRERPWANGPAELISFSLENKRDWLDQPAEKASTQYEVFQLEYTSAERRRARFSDAKVSTVKNVAVLTTIDRFAEVFIRSNDRKTQTQVLSDPNLLRSEISTSVSIPPPPPAVSTRLSTKGIPEPIVRNGYTDSTGKHWTGKDVIVAIMDTGIDFTHPDFITYDEHGNPWSRFDAFWDITLEFCAGRGVAPPLSYPNKTPIGTLFEQRHFTEELRAIQKGKPRSIPSTDDDGHGTACASIAAGNGNADWREAGLRRAEVQGVAPQARLIGIRIGKDGSNLTNSYLLNVIYEWLDQIAGDRPLVISASYGGHRSGHDGQTIGERELNARIKYGEKKGRAIVFSAGNESRTSIHARANFSNVNDASVVSWDAKKDTKINVFFNTAMERQLKIIAIGPTKIEEDQLSWERNRITDQIQATLSVKAGPGQIKLFNSAGVQTEAHFYFASPKLGMFTQAVENSYLITAPGSAAHVITVGSSVHNDNFHLNGKSTTFGTKCNDNNGPWLLLEIGGLSCYSSPGPTRDNRHKPDVVAPGEIFTASYSGSAKGDMVDTTRKYVPMTGTSAATAYTAGIIALLFEKEPDLTTNRIKKLLESELTKTNLRPGSNQFPNPTWGNGKLDMASVGRLFNSLQESKLNN